SVGTAFDESADARQPARARVRRRDGRGLGNRLEDAAGRSDLAAQPRRLHDRLRGYPGDAADRRVAGVLERRRRHHHGVRSGGHGTITGVEAHAYWLPTDRLTLRAGCGWLAAEYDRIQEGVIRPDGAPLPLDSKFVHAPARSWNIGFDYALPVARGAGWGFH